MLLKYIYIYIFVLNNTKHDTKSQTLLLFSSLLFYYFLFPRFTYPLYLHILYIYINFYLYCSSLLLAINLSTFLTYKIRQNSRKKSSAFCSLNSNIINGERRLVRYYGFEQRMFTRRSQTCLQESCSGFHIFSLSFLVHNFVFITLFSFSLFMGLILIIICSMV